MRILIIALAGDLLVQGCASIQNREAIDARTALIGRSRPEIMACAGIPNKVAKAGTKEIATYSVADRYSASGVVLGQKDCTVNIVLEAGRVASVDYFVEDPGPIAPLESCAEIVSTCLRQ
jgi:pectin methylesterase-like acyl-CoA thioesterase